MAEIEGALQQDCEEIIGVPGIDRDTSLVVLGASSLSLMRLIARIHGNFGVLVELEELLADISIRQLATLVQGRLADAAPNFSTPSEPPFEAAPAPTDSGEGLPLDDLQLPFWNVCKYRPAKRAYNEAVTYLIEGPLDLNVCRRILERFVISQPALRTAFFEEQSGPVQKLLPVGNLNPVALEERDFSGSADPMRACADQFREMMQTEFAFSRPPLLRAFVWRIGARRHIVGCVLPHLICDHWSVEIMVNAAIRWYREFLPRTSTSVSFTPEREVSLPDARGALLSSAEDEQFWRELMVKRPAPVDVGTRPRPAIKSYQGDMLRGALSLGNASILDSARATYGATAASLMFAAFGLLIATVGRVNEVTLGVPVLLRERAETGNLIGLYLNTLPITVHANDATRVSEYVADCNARWTAAIAHGRYPVHRLIEALSLPTHLSRSPLFEYHFTYYEKPPVEDARADTGLEATEQALASGSSKFDLTFFLTREGEDLWCQVEYCTALFTRDEIGELLGKYQSIADFVLREPAAFLSDLRRAVGSWAGSAVTRSAIAG